MVITRVSSKQTNKNFGLNRNKPKQDLFLLCFGLFRYVSVFLTYIETTETNRTVLKQTETNQNNPKFSEKYQNLFSIKLFRLVFCSFWFNRNIETLCFGIEAKKPKQTKTNRKNPKFSDKNTKICSLSNCFGWYSVCFFSIKTSKTLCFGIEAKQLKQKFCFG